jgi:hypothetical protein
LGFLILNEMGEDFLYRLFGQRSTDWLIRAPVPQARQDGLFERLSFGTSRGESVRYFAYGSSMSPVDFGQLMGWQETELGKFIEVTTPKRAILKGYRLEFNRPSKHDPQREGRANIVPDPNGQVEGVLYRLSRTGFEFLDKHQTGYRREIVRVLEDGREVDALAFIAEESREGLVPSRSYLERLLLGAQQWKLSPEYQERLKGTATTEEEPKTRSTAA